MHWEKQHRQKPKDLRETLSPHFWFAGFFSVGWGFLFVVVLVGFGLFGFFSYKERVFYKNRTDCFKEKYTHAYIHT